MGTKDTGHEEYIDSIGIRTIQKLEDHIRFMVKQDIMVVKTSKEVRVIWCSDNILRHVNIEVPTIYCVKIQDVNEIIKKINPHNNNLSC